VACLWTLANASRFATTPVSNNDFTVEKIMKKYLALATLLGAVAFLSVSYLAEAQQPAADAPPVAAAPADAATAFAKDKADCEVLAAASTTEGAAPSDADKAATVKKCLTSKGHSEEEITKENAAAAPVAPAAPEAPAAK
jgi:hypothetical protein